VRIGVVLGETVSLDSDKRDVQSPKISVSIATYNRAAMVRQAIEAALAQTLAPVEIVVTDDASTDNTWDVLQSLAANQPRVRVFRRDANSGGVANWNFAIANTHGDYIAWCSDDDRFLPDHLEASVDYLEAYPEVGLVHAGFVDAIETAEDSQRIPRPLRFSESRVLKSSDLLKYLTRYYDWPFHPSTIVMRRTVWEQAGAFDPAFALADTDWFVRAVEQFPAALLARHGVLNRRHPGNWSNRLGSAKMQSEIFEIVEGFIRRHYAGNPLRRAAWKMIWRNNVRLRLMLTLASRMRTGHKDAACAAWRQMLQGTGRRTPEYFTTLGESLIRRWCARRVPVFDDARQSVSPL
jgi:glycosyltransferase involved in cell wall biosynthesis